LYNVLSSGKLFTDVFSIDKIPQ